MGRYKGRQFTWLHSICNRWYVLHVCRFYCIPSQPHSYKGSVTNTEIHSTIDIRRLNVFVTLIKDASHEAERFLGIGIAKNTPSSICPSDMFGDYGRIGRTRILLWYWSQFNESSVRIVYYVWHLGIFKNEK